MKKKRFLVIAYDKRQEYLRKMLCSAGHDVTFINETDKSGEYRKDNKTGKSYKFNTLNNLTDKIFDAILLPVSDSIRHYKRLYGCGIRAENIFGCGISGAGAEPDINSCDAKDGIISGERRFIEYMESDAAAYANAVATAEGAVAQAVTLSDINLNMSNVLLAGFGRCGEILANRLQAFNCNVTVLETDEGRRAKAGAYGYAYESDIAVIHDMKKYDFLFNTVPEKIFNSDILQKFSKEITIIDIASNPGGVDFDYCIENDIKACHALGLPGKFAPESSAKVLLEVIKKNMKIV